MAKKLPIGYISESFEKPVNEVGRELKRTVVDGFASDFFSQLLGVSLGEKKSTTETPAIPTSTTSGEIFNIANLQKSADKKPAAFNKDRLVAKPERRAAAIERYDYHREIINAEKNISRKEMSEMTSRI